MQQIRNLFKFIQEDVLGTDNRYIAFAWTLAVALVFGLGVYLTSESMSFMGVAESREIQINFEHPVEIKRIHVLPGQTVKQGDLLIDLNDTALNTRLRELQMQLSSLQAEMKVRQNLNSILNNRGAQDSSDPLAVQIKDLTEELAWVENQKKNLYVFATNSGIVGAVNFKKGEKVPAFAALLTISSENPTYAQGFIHESLHTRLAVGNQVQVSAANGAGPTLEGRIASVGSRIVQIPFRLTRNPAVVIWGREVVVELPEENKLLLGEKVVVKPHFHFYTPATVGLTSALASAEQPQVSLHQNKMGHHEINLPANLSNRLSFEPSGLIYLKDIKKFMIVSDDTDTNKTPYVFLMDSDGMVDDQPLRIPGIQAINDMESISTDGTSIYIMASQSQGSKSKERDYPGARNLFVRTQFSDLRFGTTEAVELRPILLNAMQASKDARVREIFAQVKKTDLEIESHSVLNDTLLIGLKTPMMLNGSAAILEVKHVSRIFEKHQIASKDLSIYQTIIFSDGTSSQHRLSDFTWVKGELYATTKCAKQMQGALWKIPSGSQAVNAQFVQHFDGFNSEGIVEDPNGESLIVTFDQGSARASFERVPLKP